MDVWSSLARRARAYFRHDTPQGGHVRRLTRVTFDLSVEIDDEPDVDGAYQVHVEPFGIATFGVTRDDAVEQAEDAMRSYLAALIQSDDLIDAFERYGVRYELRPVMTAAAEPYVEVYDDTEDRRRPGAGRALLPA